MSNRAKKQPGPSTIVNNPRLWPTSFTKPEKQTRVCVRTYIFRDSYKVKKFLDFLKEKFPNRNVDVKQLNNGNVSVSLTTQSVPSVNNNTTASNKCVFHTKCSRISNAANTSICTNSLVFITRPDLKCKWFRNWDHSSGTDVFSSTYKGPNNSAISWNLGNNIGCDNVTNWCYYVSPSP